MGQKKKIDIISPADSAYEAMLLIEAGATALYCGLFPEYFKDYPYFFSPNQRSFKEAQMNEKEFERVVDICKSKNIPIYLTINQVYFLEEQIPLIIRMAKYAELLSVDGFIMGSIPLMLHIKDAGIKTPIIASTMAVTLNSFTADFYYKFFNIKKITLPRSLKLNEIKQIVANNPNINFDTFILVGKCPNVEGFCGFLHTNPNKIWPCEQVYDIECYPKERKEIINIQKMWQGFPRSHGCGICAIPDLIKIGITGFKIVGRGSPASFKIKNVELVTHSIKLFEEEKDIKIVRKKVLSLYKEHFGHECSPFVCYFPELLSGADKAS
jgi:putative protease